MAGLAMLCRGQEVSVNAVKGWLACEALKDPKKDWSEETFFLSVGRKDCYTKKDLENYSPPLKSVSTGPDGGNLTLPDKKGGLAPLALKVRANFDDVLATEDPTLKGKAKPDELTGASLSFSRDIKNGDNTWQGKGSVILPFIFNVDGSPDPEWQMISYGLIPSVSYEGLDTQGDLANEKDSLVYRVGGFLNFGGPVPLGEPNNPIDDGRLENRLRFFATYGTDYHHDISIPAGEFEYEPRYDTGGTFALGYPRVLLYRKGYDVADADFDQSTDTLLTYQLRTIFKTVGGSVEDNDGSAALESGSFVRTGLVTELKFDPLFAERLSLTMRYQYLFALEGSDDAPDRVDATLGWALWQNKETNQKFSLTATYVNGAMDLRQKDEESFLIGLGLTY